MMNYNELDCFSGLRKQLKPLRVCAGASIVNSLSKKIWEGKLKWIDVSHIISRLIRGLGSGREASRNGYYSTLVGLLSVLPTPPLHFQVFNLLVEKHLKLSVSSSKAEEGECYLGKVLAYGSLIQSDFLLRESKQNQKYVISQLLDLSEKRSYLHHIVYCFLFEFLNKGSKEAYTEVVRELIEKNMIKSKNCLSLDHLYCLSLVKDKFHTTKLVKHILSVPYVIHIDNADIIVNSILNSSPSVWEIHPFFDLLCNTLIQQPMLISVFWKSIDSHLEHSNYNKELIIITLLSELFNLIDDGSADHLTTLVTDNVILLMINKQKEHKKVLRNLISNLCKAVTYIPSNVKLIILERILFYPGELKFDQITGTNASFKISSSLLFDEVDSLAKKCREILCGDSFKMVKTSNNTVKWSNKEKVSAVHLLARLVGHTKSSYDHIDWRKEQMLFLIDVGIFNNKKTLSSELAGVVRNIFFNLISCRFPKLINYINVITDLVLHIDKLLKQGCIPQVNLAPEVLDTWKLAIEKVQDIHHKTLYEGSQSLRGSSLEIVILLMCLMLFKEPATAKVAIRDLIDIIDRIYVADKEVNSSEPHWTEVIIDLFLHLLSKDMFTYRHIVGCVFKHICPHLNRNSLFQMLTVIDPDCNLEDINILGNIQDVDEPESDTDNNSENESSSESVDTSEGNSLSDEEEEPSDRLDKLKMLLGKTLNSYQSDEESIDIDEVSPEEGKRLNEALSNVFRTQKKHAKKYNEEKYTHFRIRVLDLIDTFLECQPSLQMVLDVLSPIFNLLEYIIRHKNQVGLLSRVKTTIKKIGNIKNLSNPECVNDEYLASCLETILCRNNKTIPVFNEMIPQIVEGTKFIIRAFCCVTWTGKKSKVVKVLKNMIDEYFTKRDVQLPLELLKSVILMNWEGILYLMPTLAKHAFSCEVKPFNQANAMQLLLNFYRDSRLYNLCLSTNKSTTLVKKLAEIVGQGAVESLQSIKTIQNINKKRDNVLLELLFSLQQNGSLHFNWDNIKSSLEQTLPLLHSLKGIHKPLLKKLCRQLGIEIASISKLIKQDTDLSKFKTELLETIKESEGQLVSIDKTEEHMSDTELRENQQSTNSSKTVKRKSKTEVHVNKLKKESKIRRLNALNDLEGVTFSLNTLEVDG